MKFFDVYLQDLRDNFDEERPVSRVVAVFIHVAAYDGRCHPAVGEDEVDSGFIRIRIRVASRSSWFAIALAFIVAYISPPVLLE